MNLSINKLLAIAALVCAIVSIFTTVSGVPLLAIAVILLALALIV
jgi:hypothetical protein